MCLKGVAIKIKVSLYIASIVILVGFGLGKTINNEISNGLPVFSIFFDQFKVGTFSPASGRLLDSQYEPEIVPEITPASDLPLLEISIKKKDLSKLKYSRRQALRTTQLLTYDDSYVRAKIRYDNNNFKAEVRLKGDLADHYGDQKSSLRVKIKKGDALFGMRRFSLQKPIVRNYSGEWLYQKIAFKERLIALRYSFVQVIINDEYKGVYAMEEHFDKMLLEYNRRKEAPIIKMNEELVFGYGWDIYHLARFKTYQEDKIFSSPLLATHYRVGNNLLENYRENKVDVATVFDFRYYSKFSALTDLTGAGHSLENHNMVFYFNPYTFLFEPIVFDGTVVGKHKAKELTISSRGNDPGSLVGSMFRNSLRYSNLYINNLRRMAEDDYLHALIEMNKSERHILNASFGMDIDYPMKSITYNHRKIKSLLEEESKLIISYDGLEQLKIEPSGDFPLLIESITLGDQGIDRPNIVISKILSAVPKKYELSINRPTEDNYEASTLNIRYLIAGKHYEQQHNLLKK